MEVKQILVKLPPFTIEDFPTIMKAVSEVTGVDEVSIIAKNRKEPVFLARHLFVGVSRQVVNCSQKEVANYLKRNHTSVGNSEGVFSDLYDTEEAFRLQYDDVILKLHEKYNS